jgi:molecular chaperone GrpE
MEKSDQMNNDALNKDESLNNDKTEQEDIKKNEKEEDSIEFKLKETQDKLLRTLAEMENQRRRFEKEKNEALEFGGFNLASESLSLLDNLDRAMISFKNDENLKDGKNFIKIIEGLEVVKKDLISIFKKNGINSIDCLNKKFDPNFHQAMLEIENDDKPNGTIIQEIQKGYMMKERLLRPSFVGVTKKRVNNVEKDEK